jgi:thiol:disulfide interchange protein DsbA
MNKREFILAGGVLALSGVPALGPVAVAAPVAGKDYRPVEPARRTEVGEGRIEVLEFFWYACPHCYSLEPVIQAWAARLPDDVEFRRVHVAFRGDQHQQLFYTLEAMGKTQELDDKVFEAIHRKRQRLNREGEILDWAKEQGLDMKAFEDAWNSFGVRTQMKKASKLVDDYAIDGVPMLAVNGKYLTAPSIVGSNEGALEVVDALIAAER